LLYRLSRYDGTTGDLVHRYTTSASLWSTLQSQGFAYEGITGYVYTTPFPTVAGGLVFGARLGCQGMDYRDCTFGSYVSVSSIGARPSWATAQEMRFKFWTPDMFATSTGLASSGEHLLFTPRGVLHINTSNLYTSQFGCPADDSALVLRNRTWYEVSITVSNTGLAAYSIRGIGTFASAAGSVQYGSAPAVEPPFNSTATGYFITNAQGAQRDYTLYVTNLQVYWK